MAVMADDDRAAVLDALRRWHRADAVVDPDDPYRVTVRRLDGLPLPRPVTVHLGSRDTLAGCVGRRSPDRPAAAAGAGEDAEDRTVRRELVAFDVFEMLAPEPSTGASRVREVRLEAAADGSTRWVTTPDEQTTRDAAAATRALTAGMNAGDLEWRAEPG